MKTLKEIALRDFGWDLLFHAPSALILLFYSKLWLYSIIVEQIRKTPNLYNFLKEFQLPFHIILILIAILLPLISKYRTALYRNTSSIEEIMIRLTAIFNKVVNAKETRFRKMLQKVRNDSSISQGKIFKTITEPIVQVQLLSENLLGLFRHICDNNNVKLTVIICEDNKLKNFVYHSDHEPKVSINELKNGSFASKALQERKSIVCSSVNGSTVGFLHGESRIKSIFCTPIIKSSEVNFILSFSSKNENDIKKELLELYDYLIDQIANRFVLEWQLNSIKNIKNGE